MESKELLNEWQMACAFLPPDLDTIARETGAIVRFRGVDDARQLLRAFLIYASTGSLRSSAALANSGGLLKISSVGLFYRLKHSEVFLERVLAWIVGLTTQAPVGFRLAIVDASSVCGPAATETDWRVHVGYDPLRGLPCSVSITSPAVGESLALHKVEPGMLILGDRGYGSAKNLDIALQAGADVLIRIQRGKMRICDDQRKPVDWNALESQIPQTGALSVDLRVPVPPLEAGKTRRGWRLADATAWHDVRLVGARNNKGEVIWLMTNLDWSRLSDQKACELYRVRWQVELYFKRLKSLGDLDMQPTRNGPTAKAIILAKMILLTLTSLLQDKEQAFSPYGYPVGPAQPLA